MSWPTWLPLCPDLVPGTAAWYCCLVLLHCLAGYDEEARYFESGVSEAKREDLVAALEGLVRPAYEAQLALLRELALTVLKQQLQMDDGVAGESCVERAHRWVGRQWDFMGGRVAASGGVLVSRPPAHRPWLH